MRDGGWGNRRLAADIRAGMPTAVAELDRCLGARGVNVPDQTRQPGKEAVVVYSQLVPPMPPRALRRCHFHRDETDPATRAGAIIGKRVRGDVALLVRGPGRHRRHDDPVGDFDRTDARGGEQDVRIHSTGISPPSRSMVAPVSQLARAERMKVTRSATSSTLPK